MNGWQIVTQEIMHILSNSAWSGISSICSLLSIPLAIHLARKSKTSPLSHPLPNKKKLLFRG